MGKIQELPKPSACLLTSSQIITSVFCVVKELVENALDCSSKNVEVKLEDYGIEKIEVKDNGCGIDKEDIQFAAKPHFTSKISSYSDLEKLNTYGFRGEALGAICAVADLVIITKTDDENFGHCVNFGHDGQIISNKPFPSSQGTTVSVKNLFKNIPVRKQYYRSEKNKKDELQKVKDLLIAYGCIQNDVRFALYHNRNLIWQKPPLSNTKNALIHIFGNAVCDHLKHVEYMDEKSQNNIEIFLPKLDAPMTCSLTSPNKCILSINRRPVRMKAVDKLLKEYYNASIQNDGKSRYPICFISIIVPSSEVDVNLEPNKTSVALFHSEEILSQFSEMLKNFYNTDVCENSFTSKNTNQDVKSNTSDFLDSFKDKCVAKIQQAKIASDSPIASAGNHSQNKNTNIVNSLKKTDSLLSKNDVSVVSTATESKKKRLKSIISKTDMKNHINTLNTFFPREENEMTEQTNLPLNSSNVMHSVTVQKMGSDLSGLFSDVVVNGNHMDSEKINTFAVSENLSSNTNFPTDGNCIKSRKRHFSESSIFIEKLSEDAVKRPILYLNVQSADAWSRGIHPTGGLFQPVKVLQPKTINIPEICPKENDDLKKKEITIQKKLSFERKLTAFDIFCRSYRLEISAQNPEMTNEKIAEILCEKWSHLSAEEKAVYKNMLDKDYPQQIKKKEKLGNIVSQNLNQERSNISSCKASKKKLKHKVKVKSISFDIEKMKSFYASQDRKKLSSEDLNLINYLAPGIWIYSKERKLYLLNTFRLQETIIYHRLLETFHFEISPLDVPQSICTSRLSCEEMEVLYQLSNMEINAGRISHEKMIANGFDIRCVRGENNEIALELIGITSCIAFYGIPDLKELLQKIKNKGTSANLSECRPGKVMLYLQSEANRMSRQSPACQRVQDVEDLLRQKKHLPLNCDECIHHKPFFSELCEY